MVAHLPLDGSGRDIAGNHSGTLNGTMPTTNPHGYAQKALDFDGSDDHVVIDEAPEFETNRHTVSVWVKSDTLASGDLVSKDNEIERQWLLEAVQGGKVRSVVWTSNIMNLRDSNKSLTQGQWHHVVRTWDGSAMSLYIDGTLDHTVDTTGDALAAGTQPVRIGGNPYHFDGSLDEFRFYDRPLHGSEVSSLHAYESQDRFANDLVVHYPLNGDASDVSEFGNTASVVGATLTNDRFGNANSAYAFNGTTGQYLIKSNFNSFPGEEITASLWMKTTGTGDGIISYATSSANNNEFLIYTQERIYAILGSISSQTNASFNDGDWHHLVVTWRNSNDEFKTYKDGVLADTRTISNGTRSAGGTLVIGQDQDTLGGGFQGSQAFDGSLDDVRIYKRVLTDSEVSGLYEQERPPHPLDSINGIALWLDASNVDGQNNTTLSNGASVSEWKDLSGNGNDALGTSFSDLPTIQDSGSQSLVDFDSSQKQSLALADATKLNFGANEDFAYVIVLKTETVADTTEAGVLSNRTGTGGYAGYQLYIIKSTGKAYSYLAQTDSLKTVASNPVNDGKFKIFMSTYDRDSSNIMYLNGLKVGSSDISNIINSDTDYPLEIGHEFFTSYVSKYYFDGEIAEILFFDQTLTENRSQIFAYLAEKWDLTTSVDSDGDGFTDAVEKGKGTSPIDPSDKPSDLPSLLLADANKLWLDAENIDGEGNASLSDGDDISEWKDLSRSNHHLNQSDANRQPLLVAGENGENDVIRFDSDRLSRNTFSGWPDGSITVFIVQKGKDDKASTMAIEGFTSSTQGRFNIHLVWSGNTSWDYGNISGSSYGRLWAAHGEHNTDQHYIYEFSYNDASSDMYTYKNATQLGYLDSTVSNVTNINGQSGYTLHVGSDDGTSNVWFTGDIAEILVFDKDLSSEESTTINAYLSNKWGLSIDSDVDY